jgi:hypothetical protein
VNNDKWLIVIPPHGAARPAALDIAQTFSHVLGNTSFKTFDTKNTLDFFLTNINQPNEELATDLVNHALIVQCLDFGADHLLVCALSPITLFTLKLLQKQHIKTVHWFYEDYKRATYWKDVIAGYDYFFAIQRGPVESECIKAGSTFTLLPTAVTTGNTAYATLKTTDIGFIGIPSPYRIAMLEHLHAHGFSLSVAGLGWNTYHGPLQSSIASGNWILADTAFQILSLCRIGINLSTTDPDPDCITTHVSPRVFDILASHTVLVTENVPLAHEILNGFHFHTFDTKENAVEVIKHVLDFFQEEPEWFDKNKKLVFSGHTYENRVRKILDICKS